MFKLRHIGIVVRNLEKSKEFYSDIFDLKIVNEMIEAGPYVEKLVGIKDASISWAKMKALDETVIELLEYQKQEAQDKDDYASNRLGCSHIAISVGNIEEVYNKLKSYGCTCKSEPLFSPDGKVKVVYAHDLDGTILEIVEEL